MNFWRHIRYIFGVLGLILSSYDYILSEAWISSGSSHEELVKNLYANRVVDSLEVYNVLSLVDRGIFVPYNDYEDRPQSIGYDATISAPHMHAYALEALREHVKPGSTVLDVGSGSGYLTACFAVMVGQSGVVVGVEHIDELTKMATKNIENWLEQTPAAREAGIKLGEQIKLITGDGRLGWPEEAPYDAIHVGAAAVEIPDALMQQLKPGGRMIIPHGQPGKQWLVQVDRDYDGSFRRSSLMPVMYVSLMDLSEQLAASRNRGIRGRG